ncbi:MAG TPA: T9SS type A sorting domain-containing protein [Chitinophagales bacterium]|nr:T9SS type A sorting domain-containing protein [Chitinophagales bacterium]
MKTIVAAVILSLLVLQVFSQQQFQLLIHPGFKQEARFMSEILGSGYLLASNFTDTSGEKSILLTRLDNQLNVVWHTLIDETGTAERVNSFAQDASGNIFIAGYIEDSFATAFNNSLLIKADSTGNVIWKKRFQYSDYNNDLLRIFSSASGSLYAIGESEDYYYAPYPYYMQLVMKLNSSGTILWSHTYPTSLHSNVSAEVLPASDGTMIVAGHSLTLNTLQASLTKFDTTGSKVWDTRWSLSGINNFPVGLVYDLSESNTGGYIIYGQRGIDSEYVLRNCMLKYDANGTLLKQMRYGYSYDNWFYPISTIYVFKGIPAMDGGYAAAGVFLDEFSGEQGIALLKVDSGLVPQWCKLYDMGTITSIASLLQTSDGGYLIAASRGDSIILLKTDAQGSNSCNEQVLPVFYQLISDYQGSSFLESQSPSFTVPSYLPNTATLTNNFEDTLCFVYTSSQADQSSKACSLFPDPSHNIINISISDGATKLFSMSLFNEEGAELKREIISSSNYSLDVSTLPAGMYMVRISSRSSFIVKKFLKL